MFFGRRAKKQRTIECHPVQMREIYTDFLGLLSNCDVCQSGRQSSQGRAPTTQTTVRTAAQQ